MPTPGVLDLRREPRLAAFLLVDGHSQPDPAAFCKLHGVAEKIDQRLANLAFVSHNVAGTIPILDHLEFKRLPLELLGPLLHQQSRSDVEFPAEKTDCDHASFRRQVGRLRNLGTGSGLA
jgi:hypothetical protein